MQEPVCGHPGDRLCVVQDTVIKLSDSNIFITTFQTLATAAVTAAAAAASCMLPWSPELQEPGPGTRDICLDCAQLTPLKLTTAATTHIISCAVFCSCSTPYTMSHIVSRARLRLFLIDTTSYDLCTLMLQSLPILSVDSKFIWNKHWCCWSHCYCMSHIKQSYLKWNCSTSNEYAAAAGSSLSPHCPCARVWCRVCIVQPSVPCSVRYRWHVVIEFRHMIDQTFCCSLLKLLSSYI